MCVNKPADTAACQVYREREYLLLDLMISGWAEQLLSLPAHRDSVKGKCKRLDIELPLVLLTPVKCWHLHLVV